MTAAVEPGEYYLEIHDRSDDDWDYDQGYAVLADIP